MSCETDVQFVPAVSSKNQGNGYTATYQYGRKHKDRLNITVISRLICAYIDAQSEWYLVRTSYDIWVKEVVTFCAGGRWLVILAL